MRKMMKAFISTRLSIFSILLVILPSSSAVSTSVQDSFLHCLSNQSQPSNPISQAIYTPQNSSFSSVLQSYVRNLRYSTSETPKPLAIVAALHESHVQATVFCAKSVGLQIRIRSGGHDYDGLSYVSHVAFVVLDMFNLRSINISMKDETAWVQAGASLGELYYKIAESSPSHAFPAGICTTLGAGGHFSGGGYGNLMRKYGLSIDNIVDAQIVDANGRILDRKSMGEDLFWAIRGGGAASFCVVLSWKINLVRVPETLTVFKAEKTVEQGATDVVFKWQQIADTIDEDLFIRLTLSPVNGTQPGKKTVKASFMAMFLGSADQLVRLLQKSFPELGLHKKDCMEMRWVDSILFWLDYPNGTSTDVLLERIPKRLIYLKRKSDYVQEPISKEGLEAIWQAIIESESVAMAWNPYGGKMGQIPSTATAFPHRAGNKFKIQYSVNWIEGGDQISNNYLNLTRKLFEAMTPYVSKSPREAFLNYRDIDIGVNSNGSYEEGKVYGVKYFKENFDRLVSVKAKVDPTNFFRYEQSIPIPGSHPKRIVD